MVELWIKENDILKKWNDSAKNKTVKEKLEMLKDVIALVTEEGEAIDGNIFLKFLVDEMKTTKECLYPLEWDEVIQELNNADGYEAFGNSIWCPECKGETKWIVKNGKIYAKCKKCSKETYVSKKEFNKIQE
jgi:hypothetical protein